MLHVVTEPFIVVTYVHFFVELPGNQVSHRNCTAMHVKGAKTLLTLLAFGPEQEYVCLTMTDVVQGMFFTTNLCVFVQILALYSRMSPRELKGFDVSTADRCVQLLLERIHAALVQLQIYKQEPNVSELKKWPAAGKEGTDDFPEDDSRKTWSKTVPS